MRVNDRCVVELRGAALWCGSEVPAVRQWEAIGVGTARPVKGDGGARVGGGVVSGGVGGWSAGYNGGKV